MVKYDEKIDSILRNWVDKFPRSYFKKIKAKSNKHILDYIEKCTPLLNDEKFLISTKVYWVLNKIQDFPKCKICGNKLTKNVKATEGYPSHCSAKCLSDDPDVLEHKQKSYEKRYGAGITNPFQAREVISKIDKTNVKKYGTRRFTQTDKFKSIIIERNYDIEQKKRNTRLANKSYSESKSEKIAFELLKKKHPDLIWHYTSDEYPFECDFYSPADNIYMEYNGTWTHGEHPFDENNQNDINKVNEWKSKTDKNGKIRPYYKNAIYTWTNLDVRKRRCAISNGLKYILFWNLKEVYEYSIPDYNDILLVKDIIIPFRRSVIENEFIYYRDAKCPILNQYVSTRNEIVKFFQQDTFFKEERKIWNEDSVKRNKLIENRMKYLKKDACELTHCDILNGFKRSGIYYGYSHFNPLWFKWFIEKYGLKKCYDPTGGWGHRLLGGLSLEKYIYNDKSRTTKKHVDEMIDFFNIKNTVTYCSDARSFIPDEDFDSMFTCPPYFNLEKYECGGFGSKIEFDEFIECLFNIFNFKNSCNIFGLVIREDLLCGHDNFSEKIEINIHKANQYLSDSDHRNKEFLYIFKK